MSAEPVLFEVGKPIPDANRRPCRRGTSNTNQRGNARDRRRRREWLVETYRANVDVVVIRCIDRTYVLEVPLGEGEPACRCYRCGDLLTVDTVSADRIYPGAEGGQYGTPRKDARRQATNARPCCVGCNSATGGLLAAARKRGE